MSHRVSSPAPPGQNGLALNTLAAGLASFLTLGVIQAMYGPAFPWFQQRFGVSTSVVAVIASAHFFGSAAAPLVAGAALRTLSAGRVTIFSLLVLAGGASLVAFAPSWLLALVGSFIGGLGCGAVSAAVNSSYAALGTRSVNLVNAVFGVGSVLSPLLVAALVPRWLGWPFVVVAILSLLTLVVVGIWKIPDLPRTVRSEARGGPTNYLPTNYLLVALFVLLLGGYVSLEVGFGAWLGKHLSSLGWHNPAVVVSSYWGGLTLGRVLMGLFGGSVRPGGVVLAAIVLATTCAALALVWPTLAVVVYPLAGLALGPVFATSLVWMSQRLSADLIPFLLVAGSVGGILSPSLLGWTASRFGWSAIPGTLLLLGLLVLAVIVALRQQEKTPG